MYNSLLGQLCHWTKVPWTMTTRPGKNSSPTCILFLPSKTYCNSLLGQLCHWTKVRWKTVSLNYRPLDNCCNTVTSVYMWVWGTLKQIKRKYGERTNTFTNIQDWQLTLNLKTKGPVCHNLVKDNFTNKRTNILSWLM